jgi:hypothetical protein
MSAAFCGCYFPHSLRRGPHDSARCAGLPMLVSAYVNAYGAGTPGLGSSAPKGAEVRSGFHSGTCSNSFDTGHSRLAACAQIARSFYSIYINFISLLHSRNRPTLELSLTESELRSSECINLPSRG